MRYLVFIIALFATVQTNAQNNIVYGAGINYTNGAPTFTPPVRTSRVAIDTVTGKWYHFNTPGGWQLIGNTIEEIAGCTAPAYTPGKGDSKVVINNCSPQPELYFYNGSAWVLVGGGSVYAGEGIRIENDTIILDSLNFLDFRTGNALDGDVGRVQWNDTDGTLDLNLKGGNVTLQIGQEEVSLVKHADNLGLIEGRVVYIVGSDGANKTVRYAKADSDATSATTFGLMTESATGGGKAFCTTFGLVRDLNTTNLTEGGIVWLSADTAGTMTAVRPTAPEHGVMIGFCIRKHATQGAIFVQVQNGYELNELHDVFVPSPTNGQVLTWNSTNARWEAITPANQLQTLSTDNTPGNISISSGNTITLNVNDADASATNELQTLSVAANTATLSNSGGSVTIAGAGINTVGTAGTTITVTGTEVDGSTTNELQTLSTGTNTLTLSNGGGTVTVDTDPTSDVTGSGASGQVSFWTGTQTQSGDNGLFWDNANKNLGIATTSPLGRIHTVVTAATGYNAIFQRSVNAFSGPIITFRKSRGNTASPTFVQAGDILGFFNFAGLLADNINYSDDVAFFGAQAAANATTSNLPTNIFFKAGSSTSYNASFYIHNSGRSRFGANNMLSALPQPNAKLEVIGEGNSSSTWTAQFHNSGGSNNALMIRDDGNVGIGTSSPTATFTLRGNASTTNTLLTQNSAGVQGFTINSDGRVAIGVPASDVAFRVQAALTGAYPYSYNNEGTMQSGVNEAIYNGVFMRLANGITVSGATGYYAALATPPVGSTLTNSYGFIAESSLGTNATRAYAFNGRIAAGTNKFNLYMSGTATNYLAGQLAIGTTTPNASAALDVASTTQGVLFPRMTTAQRDLIATPADGLVIYNTTDNKLQVRAAGAWVDLH